MVMMALFVCFFVNFTVFLFLLKNSNFDPRSVLTWVSAGFTSLWKALILSTMTYGKRWTRMRLLRQRLALSPAERRLCDGNRLTSSSSTEYVRACAGVVP